MNKINLIANVVATIAFFTSVVGLLVMVWIDSILGSRLTATGLIVFIATMILESVYNNDEWV